LEESPYADTTVSEFWPNVIRSAVVPGYGQIMQERPGKAVIFYGIAGSFIYNGAYNYYWYNRTNDNKYLDRFRKYALLYGQLYLINMFDVINTQRQGKNLIWKSEMFSDYPMKSPWGAAIRSAMLPGWGQFYNDQYIKSVIVFGIVADFVRKAIVSNIRYMDSGKKGYLERRSVNIWYAGLAYTLNMVDAFVDAYLYNFDQIMDFSMTLSPKQNTVILNLTLSF
jgi:TM2 domain-containing membrane protein YozV